MVTLLCEKEPLNACKANNENIVKTNTINTSTSRNIISDLRIALTIVFRPF